MEKALQDAVLSPDETKVAVRLGMAGKVHVFDAATGDELVSHEGPMNYSAG